jgi:GNAT superfamily N-acetyltransferase
MALAPDVPTIDPRRFLLARVPDTPRWVETRGILLSGRCRILWTSASRDAFAIRSDPGSLVCCFGAVEPAAVLAATSEPDAEAVLCAPEFSAMVGRGLPGWSEVPAVLHRLAAESAAESEPAARVAMLSRADAGRLSHLPDALRREIADAIDASHVAAAFLEGIPVAFCHPVYETETLWDVSVDTLEAYRRRGLARTCFEYMRDHLAAHGKEPVWGALADNEASLRLAAKLGFREVDRSVVYLRPPDRRLRA